MNSGDSPGSILDEIAERMWKFPQAEVVRGISSIWFEPSEPDGFPVRLRVNPPKRVAKFSVFYAGSRVDLDGRESAVTEFGFGLSNGCRVREFSRNGKAHRWIVDLWDERGKRWKPDWDCVQFHNPLRLLHPLKIRVLQNRLIDFQSGDFGGGSSCPVCST